MRKLNILLVTCVLMLSHVPAYIQARSVYQEPEEFIEEVFDKVTPQKKRLWIKKDLKQKINDILGHDLPLLRIRYWQDQQRTAWILEEIGKSEPITMGFVVNGGAIEVTRVLVFRESRGWEIRHPFFTDQYKDVTLKEDLESLLTGKRCRERAVVEPGLEKSFVAADAVLLQDESKGHVTGDRPRDQRFEAISRTERQTIQEHMKLSGVGGFPGGRCVPYPGDGSQKRIDLEGQVRAR